MYRTRAYRRDARNKAIARKKRICREIYGTRIGGKEKTGSWYKHAGQYSKGKIHCSCRMCTFSKYYDLPRLSDYQEKEYVREALEDYFG